MPKSQIIIDIVEDAVSLEKSLTRVLVLAKDIHNQVLENWATNELTGYKNPDDVPDYRKTKHCKLKYSGINGAMQVKNLPLPPSLLKKEILEVIETVCICEGITTICDFANSESAPVRDLSELAGQVYKESGGMVTCTMIQQVIPQSVYQTICSEIKRKLISALCELEKQYGNLDALGIDVSSKKALQLEIDNADMNKAVFNINVPQPEKKKDPWYSKVAWNIVVPIITAIAGGVVVAIVQNCFGL